MLDRRGILVFLAHQIFESLGFPGSHMVYSKRMIDAGSWSLDADADDGDDDEDDVESYGNDRH